MLVYLGIHAIEGGGKVYVSKDSIDSIESIESIFWITENNGSPISTDCLCSLVRYAGTKINIVETPEQIIANIKKTVFQKVK
jgi:hypothetical protein